MIYQETQKRAKHERRARNFQNDLETLALLYEARYPLLQFCVLITDTTDDYIAQMNLQVDNLKKRDPSRIPLLREIRSADASTVEKTGRTALVSCLQPYLITDFAKEADDIAITQYFGSTDRYEIEQRGEETPWYEQQLFYVFRS